ncbi:Asp-tRNA(Asn)/Glu-tRNA(Gln) amidotransferase subunit GatC [Algoriphagus confluentis]|uniref:Aspartyl/glutamyl-tRNA(Asn/Gln) amidotransferase subunit C n=1 Tax=Algoriphagus confluentis TaxID=1697556 RepID=A0ABQ6PIF0_9BACT|nr:Asp-tRNA(Asn)/Glu-tRNA(Gln) amidotransferase subunit GatC [Algoriphagus confluentis]
MKIDKETIKKIAHLARLEFDESSAEKMSNDMSQILDWVEQLNEVDTEGVEPLTTMSSEVNVMREDKVGTHLSHEEALKNAPQRDSDYFRVPKVLESNE